MSWLVKYYEDVRAGKTEAWRFVEVNRETGEPVYEYYESPLIVGEEMKQILERLIQEQWSKNITKLYIK